MADFVMKAFFLAAGFSLLREPTWRRVTFSSNCVRLELTGVRDSWKPLESIREIQVHSQSGSKIAVKINWMDEREDAWIIAGTADGPDVNGVFARFAR